MKTLKFRVTDEHAAEIFEYIGKKRHLYTFAEFARKAIFAEMERHPIYTRKSEKTCVGSTAQCLYGHFKKVSGENKNV